MPATADAVSWQQGAISFVPLKAFSSASEPLTEPSNFPVDTIDGAALMSRPQASKRALLHVCDLASINPVCVALLNSATRSPPRRISTYSGKLTQGVAGGTPARPSATS